MLPDKQNKTLLLSFWDGFFASIMTGLTQDFFTPFLLLCGGNAFQAGVLSALPNLAGAILAQKSSDCARKLKSRLFHILIMVMLQVFSIIPMAFLAYSCNRTPWIFILLVTLFTSSGAISLPVWLSLMGNLVDENKRGDYWGWRNRLLGFVTVTASLGAGIMLDLKNPWTGFTIIFTLAAAARIVSWVFLTGMSDPAPVIPQQPDALSLRRILLGGKSDNFSRFLIYIFLIGFSVNFSGPFYSVYMLEELRFSYLLYTLLILSSTLTVYLAFRKWGNLCDRIGNVRVMRFSARYIAIVPFLWLISSHPLWIFAAQIFAGFAWSGYNMAISNFIFDLSPPDNRTGYIAVFNLFFNLSVCLGSLSGGILKNFLPPVSGSSILTVILISGILRMIAVHVFHFRPAEIRKVERMSSTAIFYKMTGIKLFAGWDRPGNRIRPS